MVTGGQTKERKAKRNLEKDSREREERDGVAELEGSRGSRQGQAKVERSVPRLMLFEEGRG